MATSLTRSLVKLLAKPVDQKTCQRATLHLLDWIGCSVIGTQQPAGHILVDRSSGLPKGNLSSIGACALASPEDAVFLNGGLGSILEMDDVHRTAILHPGPVVIPAALGSAQLNNASGLGFLRAITKDTKLLSVLVKVLERDTMKSGIIHQHADHLVPLLQPVKY